MQKKQQQDQSQIKWISDFIWNIADDRLRDVYVRGKYRDVILPFTVLRRLDAVLESTKQAVLERKKFLDTHNVAEQDGALRMASGQAFYNTSRFTLRDQWGGWTLAAPQKWWGHKAEKASWFYVVGCAPGELPALPYVMGEAAYVVQSRKRTDYRPHITKAEREHTPPALAEWLVELARRCKTFNC